MSVQVVSRRGVSGRTRQAESEIDRERERKGGWSRVSEWVGRRWWKRESERRDVLITSIDVHLQ